MNSASFAAIRRCDSSPCHQYVSSPRLVSRRTPSEFSSQRTTESPHSGGIQVGRRRSKAPPETDQSVPALECKRLAIEVGEHSVACRQNRIPRNGNGDVTSVLHLAQAFIRRADVHCRRAVQANDCAQMSKVKNCESGNCAIPARISLSGDGYDETVEQGIAACGYHYRNTEGSGRVQVKARLQQPVTSHPQVC
jgi:hypothetical protein